MRSEIISDDGVTAQFFQTSRAWCQRVLANRPKIQRPVQPQSIKAIAKDLINAEWENRWDPIRITSNGEMIDGQHRVNAFLKTDVYPQILLMTGFDLDVYVGIDTGGIPKSMSQSFRLMNIKNYTTASAVAANLANYLSGEYLSARVSLADALQVYWPREEIIQFSIKEFRDLEGILSKSRKAFLMTAGIEFIGKKKTVEFFRQVESGIGKQGPLLFRKRMVANSNKARGKLSSQDVIALGIKAINAFADDTPIQVLKWAPGEKFPRIKMREGDR